MLIEQTYVRSTSSGEIVTYDVPKGTLTMLSWQVATAFQENSNIKFAIYWSQNGSMDEKYWYKIDQVYTRYATLWRTLPQGSRPYILHSYGKGKLIFRSHVFGDHHKRETFIRWSGDFE